MPDPSLTSLRAPADGSEAPRSDLIDPLEAFYARERLALPAVEQLKGSEVPGPYQSLLVHSLDMTPTLKKFYGQNIHIRVLSHHWEGQAYFREVVLVLDSDEKPVEFGAIKINLDLFPPGARLQILSERLPLGDILQMESVQHTSRPKAFFRLESDQLISAALQLDSPVWLYGRRNTLFNFAGQALAEIVEVLPP